jgi:hypothetical protein
VIVWPCATKFVAKPEPKSPQPAISIFAIYLLQILTMN